MVSISKPKENRKSNLLSTTGKPTKQTFLVLSFFQLCFSYHSPKFSVSGEEGYGDKLKW